jgi:hypothetical protein
MWTTGSLGYGPRSRLTVVYKKFSFGERTMIELQYWRMGVSASEISGYFQPLDLRLTRTIPSRVEETHV